MSWRLQVARAKCKDVGTESSGKWRKSAFVVVVKIMIDTGVIQ